jgi:tetratricopeptide (TPR) repeat protein
MRMPHAEPRKPPLTSAKGLRYLVKNWKLSLCAAGMALLVCAGVSAYLWHERAAARKLLLPHSAPAAEPLHVPQTTDFENTFKITKKRNLPAWFWQTAAGREQVASALHSKDEMSKSGAIFVKAFSKQFRQQQANSLIKGAALQEQGNFDAAIAVYDDLIRRFGDDESPTVHEQIASALHGKGKMQTISVLFAQANVLQEQGKMIDAIAIYDDIVSRSNGGDNSIIMRKSVAKALLNKGVVLWKQNRLSDVAIVYGDLVRRFGDDENATVREYADQARRLAARFGFSLPASTGVSRRKSSVD